MKRIYSLLILLSIGFSNLSAAEGHLTWSVVGFDHTEWASGEGELVAYDEGSTEYKVKVKFGRFKLDTRTQACSILGTYYETVPFISMYDDENIAAINANNIAYSSYVLFEPVGDFYIKKIEFLGYSHTGAMSLPVIGFSETTSVPTGNNMTCPYNTLSFNTFEGYQDTGFPSAIAGLEVCTQFGDWIGGEEDEDEYQESIKYIRLNWSGAEFAGQMTDRGASLDLFGFQIYTNIQGLGTGIEGVDGGSFSISKKGDLLEFSSLADVKVYSLSGDLQLNVSAVEEVSLESLQQGVYIVHAKDIQTGATVTEKIVK